ncbi:hypothetical protein [Laribacter hongkongensis]|nr:hypothetical protein [Laribacter hongkongensis]
MIQASSDAHQHVAGAQKRWQSGNRPFTQQRWRPKCMHHRVGNNLRLILTGGENADISRAEALIKATSVQIVITNKDNNNHSL